MNSPPLFLPKPFFRDLALRHPEDPLVAGEWGEWMGMEGLTSAQTYAQERTRLRGLLELAPGMSLLDAGCGGGGQLIGADALRLRLAGFDFCEEALGIARRQVPSARLAAGDMARIPFRTGAFDRVLCSGVLMYLTRPQAREALRELCRVCRPGGLVLLATTFLGDAIPEDERQVRLPMRYEPGFLEASVQGEFPRARLDTVPSGIQKIFPDLPLVDVRIRL